MIKTKGLKLTILLANHIIQIPSNEVLLLKYCVKLASHYVHLPILADVDCDEGRKYDEEIVWS